MPKADHWLSPAYCGVRLPRCGSGREPKNRLRRTAGAGARLGAAFLPMHCVDLVRDFRATRLTGTVPLVPAGDGLADLMTV